MRIPRGLRVCILKAFGVRIPSLLFEALLSEAHSYTSIGVHTMSLQVAALACGTTLDDFGDCEVRHTRDAFQAVLRKHSHSYTSRGFTLYERGQGGASELKYRRERKAKDTT